jgi:cell wall-active antibiotic response 4TMS protein YvqF
MTAETRFRLTPQVVIGLFIVGFGLILTGDNLGWLDGERVLDWFWAVGFFAVGLLVFLGQARSSRLLGGLLMLVGLGLVADHFTWFRFNPWDWWPLALVVFGLMLITRAMGGPRETGASGAPSVFSAFAFWSGIRRRVAGPFQRADLSAIMGGVELDLRAAVPVGGEALLDVFAIWGGIEITVPPDWDVSNEAVAIMGGIDDKSGGPDRGRRVVAGLAATAPPEDRLSPISTGRPRLVLRGFAIMGGVEIKS